MLGEKESWESSKKLLGQPNFMELLTGYDKDNIAEAKLKKLRKLYINLDEMQPETVSKVSKAGLGLCLWVRAMDVYSDVAKEVEPKKKRLEGMKIQLDVTTAQLREKQEQLTAILSKVALLQQACDDTLNEKNRLQAESDTTANRLVRAEKLTRGLNSEGARWKNNITSLLEEKVTLAADCFLSCACISYYGGFTGSYRDDLTAKWIQKTISLNLPVSLNFSLGRILGDPVQIREWQNDGLPTDTISVNNGILVDKCTRWPLMIDPQQQANQWIRKKEEKNDVAIITMEDPNLVRTLENCIRLGKSLLIEDLGEYIEPALETVLQKSYYKSGMRTIIRIGDNNVDYDANFKLFMTTKIPNPHYLPEISIKVTLINFTVTMQGLESQLLGDVVIAERSDIEKNKIKLSLQMASDKKQLKELEAKILQMLSDSEGNILDDEMLINTLSESKMTSLAIIERVREAEITEIEINNVRSAYLPVATRGSIVYFVIADLVNIDPMYQYSLAYYTSLFSRCITSSEKDPNLTTRLSNIINHSTLSIYENICGGLFERDKLLFSTSICFQIKRQAKEIDDIEWDLFLTGPGVVDRTNQPMNPDPQGISSGLWDLLCAVEERVVYSTPLLQTPSSMQENNDNNENNNNPNNQNNIRNESNNECKNSNSDNNNNNNNNNHGKNNKNEIKPFFGLCQSIGDNWEEGGQWKRWIQKPNLMTSLLPSSLPHHALNITSFQRLLLIKALCHENLQQSLRLFVGGILGSRFAESPVSSMDEIYGNTKFATSVIAFNNLELCIYITLSWIFLRPIIFEVHYTTSSPSKKRCLYHSFIS